MKRISVSPKRLPWTKKYLSNGPEYQFIDPLSGREVRLPNQLHRDNFLVQFGEPDIEEIITEFPTVSVLVSGHLKTIRFDATVRRRDGIYVLQEVKPGEVLRTVNVCEELAIQLAAQKIFANAVRVDYELRTETDIYRFPLLVLNKRRMRQILTLHRGDELFKETDYLGKISQMREKICTNMLSVPGTALPLDLQRMEAALYRLYAAGKFKLNLREARYGAHDSYAAPITS